MENSKVTIPSGYFHMCSDGHESGNLIICVDDLYAAFNLIGVCAANHPAVKVLAFCIEDSHFHALLSGVKSDCESFSSLLKRSYMRHVVMTRGGKDGVNLQFENIPIRDDGHLMNVGAYIVAQATKDGKAVLPCDYKWGSGSMYFRDDTHIPIWYIDENRMVSRPRKVGDLYFRELYSTLHTKTLTVPSDWLVCNGFLLPENYVDVKMFENIYRTHNCFRVFSSISNKSFQDVKSRIADYVGVSMEDFEARKVCIRHCREQFGQGDARRLNAHQRLILGQFLRIKYHLSFRQLSILVHLPESELRLYI